MKPNYRFNPAVVGMLFTVALTTGCGSSDSSPVLADSGDSDGNGVVINNDPTNTEPTVAEPDTTDMETDPDPVATPDAENDARYRVTFSATWSAETHPINFPSNAHFSPLTGAVHSEQAVLWEFGQIASDGIEEMAESGEVEILLDEIQSVIDEGRALIAIEAAGVASSPGTLFFDLTINRDSPLVTLVSMLAPSPDWFIGVNGLSLVEANGEFVQSKTIDLVLYDAGTDSAARFTSIDENTSPRSPISLVNSFPFESDFLEGQPYVGQLTFDRI